MRHTLFMAAPDFDKICELIGYFDQYARDLISAADPNPDSLIAFGLAMLSIAKDLTSCAASYPGIEFYAARLCSVINAVIFRANYLVHFA